MTTLPDENRLELPSTWKRHLRPRAGGSAHKPDLVLAAEARQDLDMRIEDVRRSLEADRNRSYEGDALAYLDGRLTPRGAAAATLTQAVVGGWLDRFGLTAMFHMLWAEHGLPFAACAVVEALGMDWYAHAWNEAAVLSETTYPNIGWRWMEWAGHLREFRHIVAAAPEPEYAAIVEAVTAHRDTKTRRLASALVVPGREDWVDQACRDHARIGSYVDTSDLMLLEIATTAEQLEIAGNPALGSFQINTAHVASLVDRLGPDAFETLRCSVDPYCSASDKKVLYRAIAVLPTDEAFDFLMSKLDDPLGMAAVMEAAARFPRRALRAVAAQVDGATPERRKQLASIAHADPILLDDALETLDEGARTAMARLLDKPGQLPVASADALPPLLVAPPWKQGSKRKLIVVEGLIPPPVNRIVWAVGERETLGPLFDDADDWFGSDHWTQHAETLGQTDFDYTYFLASAPISIARSHFDGWDGEHSYASARELRRILGRFGIESVDRVIHVIKADTKTCGAMLPIVNLEVARIAADCFSRRKSRRAFAVEWLERHAADAATLLIPDALGHDKLERSAAEATLRHIAEYHGTEIVLDAASGYGEAAAEAILALTRLDPLDPVGVTIPRIPKWLIPATLPQVLLRGRESALPLRAVEHVATILALAAPDYPYAGVDVVAEHCDPESLARFSWALFEQWLGTGAPSKDSWALKQLVHFADDDIVYALTPLIREWPGDGQHKRAVAGLEVLGAIGTETALRGIHDISRKVRFEALMWKATEQINAVAETLDLTTEQLADRLVPDFGLDQESAVVLDYGPRQFKVGFDEQLKPFVTDMAGKPRKSLPKPGAKDDLALAEAARSRLTTLKRELKSVSAEQVKRMELAMVCGRTWSTTDFQRFFVDHALMWHLARRLVWLAEFHDEQVAFRLDEDRSCADIDETALKLPEDASIRLAHPVLLGDQVDAWSERFADYEVLQPFDQLARPAKAFTDEELATGIVSGHEGSTVPTGPLLGMAHKGWHRAQPRADGTEPGMSYQVSDEARLLLVLDPGIATGRAEENPEQTIRSVRLTRGHQYLFSENPEPPKLEAVDPVLASEALAALGRLTKTA